MWFLLVLLSSPAVLTLLLYWFFIANKSKPRWWAKHGITEVDASSVASNLEILLGRKSIITRDCYAYKHMGSTLKYCGMLEYPSPIIFVKDLDIIKKICIKDFDHFVDRRDFFTMPHDDHLFAKMVGMLKGDEWKSVRNTIRPTFTTGKIRRMMEHFDSVGKEWVSMLNSKAKASPNGSVDINILQSVSQYALEVIGLSVFGINTGTVTDPNSVFATMANRILAMNLIQFIKQNLSPRFPGLFRLLGINPFDETALKFFEDIVKESLKEREKMKGDGDFQNQKNDFQQLLLEARKGDVKAVGSDELDDFEKEAIIKSGKKDKYLTDDLIVAQAVLFFTAGFMGTAGVISFIFYALAIHQDVQDKLRKELESVAKQDGTVDYDELGTLPYLDMVCSETMRMFPPATRLERICQKDYYEPESGLFVKKGTVVCVPLFAIHHDPQHFKNPYNFDPENFSPANKAKRNPYAFMPFGLGPRNCIGMRFGQVETKAAVSYFVRNFRIEPTEKTPIPMESIKIALFHLTPKDLELRLTPLYGS